MYIVILAFIADLCIAEQVVKNSGKLFKKLNDGDQK